MSRAVTRILAVAISGAAVLVGSGSPALAQTVDPSEDPWAGVEEMLVTGSSTGALLSDTATSAIAFDAGELEDIGAQDVSDLARFTPGLEIPTSSATTPTFFIRGVGLNDQNANAAGAIAIYVDGVPINAPAIQLASLYDIENVEVLRGPQGYTDARNASGGLINTVTRKPDGEVDPGQLRTEFGNYGYQDVEGAVGFPILGDTLSGPTRLSPHLPRRHDRESLRESPRRRHPQPARRVQRSPRSPRPTPRRFRPGSPAKSTTSIDGGRDSTCSSRRTPATSK